MRGWAVFCGFSLLCGCLAGAPDVECSNIDDISCPAGEVCIDFNCLPVCTDSSDCTNPADACVDGACQAYSSGCSSHSQCEDGFFCDTTGACRRKLVRGSLCETSDACLSGFCADDVCCDGPCDGTCEACSAAWTGVSSGVCSPVSAGQKQPGDCPDPLTCDGSRSCETKPNGAVCGGSFECTSTNCVDAVCCDTMCGGFCESCISAETGVSTGTCAAIEIGNDPDDECSGVPACNGSGGCFSGANGVGCSDDYECAGGFCADGVCCNVRCDGVCEACSDELVPSTSDGTCALAGNGDDPDGECGSFGCDGAGDCISGAAIGVSCGQSQQCASGFCVDGVCCNQSCNGTCEA